MATNQTNDASGTASHVSSQSIGLTAEDEAIFDRRHDSMDAQWLYEDQDRADAARCLMWMQDRARWDLASPAVRIAEVMLP